MSTGLGEVLLAAVVTAVMGVFVMESYQTTPWLADKLMQWSVHLRYTDNPERAKVRREELTGLLEDLPTLFKLPTAGGFLLRALAYRLANRRSHARNEQRAVRRSFGARFRIALAKAGLVIFCAGTVFGVELALANNIGLASVASSLILPLGLAAGISTASEFIIRLHKFHHGLIGGTTCTLSIFVLNLKYSVADVGPSAWEAGAIALLSGTAFVVAIVVMCALTSEFKYVYFVVGIFVHIAGISFIILAGWLSSTSDAVGFSGFGFAVGALAGFVAAVERRTSGKILRSGSPVVATTDKPGTAAVPTV